MMERRYPLCMCLCVFLCLWSHLSFASCFLGFKRGLAGSFNPQLALQHSSGIGKPPVTVSQVGPFPAGQLAGNSDFIQTLFLTVRFGGLTKPSWEHNRADLFDYYLETLNGIFDDSRGSGFCQENPGVYLEIQKAYVTSAQIVLAIHIDKNVPGASDLNPEQIILDLIELFRLYDLEATPPVEVGL